MGVRAHRRWTAMLTGLALASGLLAPEPSCRARRRSPRTGDVDPTFGTNGTAFTNLHTGIQTDLMIRGSATTGDGHLLVVGDTRTDLRDSTRAIVVLRFDGNGQLDPTFGTAGTTVIGNAGRRDEAVDVAVTPDGRGPSSPGTRSGRSRSTPTSSSSFG